ncbi:GNAT family N-acetyltransferase [Actinomadura craniellae]|uniref:GNAT family N-acetyltransferase n=1 Tax=Actinomadura craniellae TaxID=2231787 RepID=A0A365GYS9_9ACTN|nr:GNAT family N-acetyltransferase [Actinomadura craniellae]RAY11995.1 GNAT family N-acetyltransferase [Actinomadura craniellae]
MADVGVRPARRADVAAIADIQVRAWRQGYRDIVPEPVLAEMTGPAALPVWRERWTEAATAPPSGRHGVLVAVANDLVVGFAAYAPAEDADQDPQAAAELVALLADPVHERAGHGSRLLAATVDLLREDGCATLLTWVFEEHEAMRRFFGSAGWAPDGARRSLAFPSGGSADMIRLHTDISAP